MATKDLDYFINATLENAKNAGSHKTTFICSSFIEDGEFVQLDCESCPFHSDYCLLIERDYDEWVKFFDNNMKKGDK